MIVLLVFVGLSGCNSTNNTTGNINIKMLEYTITTYLGTGNSTTGFYHGRIPSYNYKINGTIQNLLGYKADIKVKINFYDKKNNFLDSTEQIVSGIANTYIAGFEFDVSKQPYYDAHVIQYYDQIDHVAFNLVENMPS